jgi:hypothetical protein
MKLILVRLERRVKMQVRRLRRQTKDKGLAIRCQIILLADKGRSRPDIAQSLRCSVSWVGRVLGAETGTGAESRSPVTLTDNENQSPPVPIRLGGRQYRCI